MEIHIADSIGKEIMSVVRCDDERMDELKNVTDELDATMDKLREPLMMNGKMKSVLELLTKAHRKQARQSKEKEEDCEEEEGSGK